MIGIDADRAEIVVGPRADGTFGVHAELPFGNADLTSAYQRSLA